MIYPDWKYILAKKCIKKNEISNNPDVDILISIIKGTYPNKKAVNCTKEALLIYTNDSFTKEVLEACLLCDDHTQQAIFEITGIDPLIIDVYSRFFFDLKVFKYRLHRFSYVKEYSNPDFPDANLYKSWAIDTGINFFRWRFKAGNFDVVPREVLTNLVGDTFFRAKEHINEPITSAVTRESLKWLKQATDSIASLQKLSDGGNKDKELLTQFKLAIEHRPLNASGENISDAEII